MYLTEKEILKAWVKKHASLITALVAMAITCVIMLILNRMDKTKECELLRGELAEKLAREEKGRLRCAVLRALITERDNLRKKCVKNRFLP